MLNREVVPIAILLLTCALAGAQPQHGSENDRKYWATEEEKQKRTARHTLRRRCMKKLQMGVDRRASSLQNELGAKQVEEAELLSKFSADNQQTIILLKSKLRNAESSGGNPTEAQRIRREIAAEVKRDRADPALARTRKEIRSLQRQIMGIVRDEFSKDTECSACLPEPQE